MSDQRARTSARCEVNAAGRRRLRQGTGTVAGSVAGAVPDSPMAEAVSEKQPFYSYRSAMEIAEMQLPPLEYAAAGVPLEGGNICEVIGPPGLGKSRLMLWIAICQICGIVFPAPEWTGSAKPLRWLFFGTENSIRRWNHDLRKMITTLSDEQRERLRSNLFLPTLEHPDDCFMTLSGEDEACQDNVLKCIGTMRLVNPDVIVFDPWGDLCADEMRDEVQRETVRCVRQIARSGRNPNVPVYPLNHSRMGAKVYESAVSDPGNFGRNSKAIFGQCREVLNVRPAYTAPEGFGKSLEILDVKHNDRPALPPAAVCLDAETMTYKPIEGYDHKAAQEEWAKVGAKKRDDTGGANIGETVLRYALAELDARREEAAKRGGEFKGVLKGTLREGIQNRMRSDGLRAPGNRAMDDLISDLPPNVVKLTKRTRDGIFVGTPEDLRWYQ